MTIYPDIIGIDPTKYPDACQSIKKIKDVYGIPKIYVVFDKKNRLNAHGRSFRKDRLEISEKLIKTLDKDEFEGLLAHEFSHIYNRDENFYLTLMLSFFAPAIIYTILFTIIDIILFLSAHSPYNFLANLLFWTFIVLGLVSLRPLMWVSRRNEYRCDLDAITKTGKYLVYRDALIKLYTLGQEDRPNFNETLAKTVKSMIFFIFGESHPSLSDRIDYIEKIGERLKVEDKKVAQPPIAK